MCCARYTFLIKGKHCPRQTQIETHTEHTHTHLHTHTDWHLHTLAQSKAIQCSDSWQTNLFMHCTILINNIHVQHWGRQREGRDTGTHTRLQRHASYSTANTRTHTPRAHTRPFVAWAYKKCKVCLSNEIRRHEKKAAATNRTSSWTWWRNKGVCREGRGECNKEREGDREKGTGQRCRILICAKRLGAKCQRHARHRRMAGSRGQRRADRQQSREWDRQKSRVGKLVEGWGKWGLQTAPWESCN